MSANLINVVSKEFATIFQMLLQQKDSRFRGAVTEKSYTGISAQVVDQMGPIDMQQVLARFAPLVRSDAPIDSRWVSPSDFDITQQIDSFDKLKVIADPKGTEVQTAVASANRKIDDLVVAAFTANALTGVDGTTATPILAANTIAVNYGASGNTGMTVAKLRAARKILRKNEVDLSSDTIYAALTAEEEDDLLAEAQVVSTDFNEKPVLVEGRLTRFLGINFIHSERLAFSAGTIRSVPVWAKSGMHIGMWENPMIDISQRKDLSGLPWQIYLKMSLGATRLEEKKIVQVLCDEA